MGVIDNLGYISDSLSFECAQPSPVIILKAAGQAALPVLMEALSFGCQDILKMRLGTSPWHARKLRIFFKNGIFPEDIDRANKVFKYTIPLEKLLFFWFVVDLTTSFAANFQSQLFQMGQCEDSGLECTTGGGLASYVCPAPGGTTPISYESENMGGPCRIPGGPVFDVPAGAYYQIFFSLRVDPIIPSQPVFSMQQQMREVGGRHRIFKTPPVDPPWIGNSLKSSAMHKNRVPSTRFREFIMEATCDNPALGVGGSWMFAYSSHPMNEGRFIPVNCFGVPPPRPSA